MNKVMLFSCHVDRKKHVSTAYSVCFIIEKYGKRKTINILCVVYSCRYTNGRIQSQNKQRFDE